MTSSKRKRVLVIALQEATMDLISPWTDEGILPTFKKMIDEGASGTVRAVVPLSTPHTWANILTSKNAGQHGIFDYWQRDPRGKFRETDASFLKESPIWQILSNQGLTSAIINLPLTYPPQPINGFMVSGLDAPGSHRSMASPPEVYDRLTRKFGEYQPKTIFPGGKRKTEYLGLFEKAIPRQTDAFVYLLTEHAWDFALLYFYDAAMAQHYFWADMESSDEQNPYRDLIRTCYRCLDASVSRLISVAGADTTVFVVSECGAGPIRSGVHVNAWLESEGFLSWKNPPQRFRNSKALVSKVNSAAQASLSKLVWYTKRSLPRSMYFWTNQHYKALKSWTRAYLTSSDIHWSRTRAFSVGQHGNIFINLKGRDPHGIVEPGREYQVIMDKIIDRLIKLKDPGSLQNAVTRVYKAAELYDGPMVTWAPDLIIEWRDAMYMPTEQNRDQGRVFVTRWREGMSWPTTGSHRIDGIFLATGPEIKKNARTEGATIFDLMPTWLHALGQPIPPGLCGTKIRGIFGPH